MLDQKQYSTDDLGTQGEKLEREIRDRWTPIKLRGQRIEDSFRRLDMGHRADRVHDCGTYLEFGVSAEDGARLRHANFCRQRLCPMCTERRSMKIFAQASACMDWIAARRPGVRWLFLTLTMANVEGNGLAAALDDLNAGWAALRHNRRVKAAVLGSMRTLEITRNPYSGTWHPHLHCILAVPGGYLHGKNELYITQSEWASIWAGCLRSDYLPVVDIRACKEGKETGIVLEMAGRDNKLSRAKGAARYAAKASDVLGADPVINEAGEVINAAFCLSDDAVDDNVKVIGRAIHKRRLVGWAGVFKEARAALDLDDAENGDLVHTEADNLRPDLSEVLVRYSWRSGIYIRDA